MQNKNIVLWFLLISNILCLFIIVGQKANLIWPNKGNDIITLPFYDDEVLKETLIKAITLPGEKCGAAQFQFSKRGSFSLGTARVNMVCLIQGLRTVVWVTLKDVKNELANEYIAFEQLVKAENIQQT